MNCEAYREKLSDALLSRDVALSAQLAAHLRACADCVEFYETEKRLMGAVDLGLRVMVKEETPVSLLPRVREGMQATQIAGRWPTRLVPAIGALVVAFLISMPFLRRGFSPNVHNTVAGAPAHIEGGEDADALNIEVHSVNSTQATDKPVAIQDTRLKVGTPEVILLPAERAAFTNINPEDARIEEQFAASETADEDMTREATVAPVRIDEITIPSIGLENDK